MNTTQFIIETPLITIGMTCLIWFVYKWLKNSLGKKEADSNEKIVVFFFGGVICFFINYLWFVPQLLTGSIVKQTVDQQYENCKETYDTTADQCHYFQDVLNGKYNEYEQPFNIQSFLDK